MLHTYFLGILLCVGSGLALYDHGSDVVDLTPDNFHDLITDRNEVWLVEFYAPWCGHCKNLVPEYKKAAKALKGIVKVGAMDADKHRSFAKDYGVSGFPTIKIFTGRKHVPYKGARTADAFVDASLKALKSKAYERLGKRPEDSSEKPSEPETYGHNIPWKQAQKALRKLSKMSTKSQKITQEPNDQGTCMPNTTESKGSDLHPNTKSVLRIRKRPLKKFHKKKIAQKKTTTSTTTTQPTTSTTTETIEETTKLTILDKFRIMQDQLLRGAVPVAEKPKIIKALMRLKYLLQGKGLVYENATIVKRRFGDMRG